MNKHSSSLFLLAVSAVLAVACTDQSPSVDSAEKNVAGQVEAQATNEAEPANTTNAPVEEKKHAYETLEERFSYTYGVDLARKFKAGNVDLNVPIMAAGMQDGFGGGETKMTSEEMAMTMELYRKVHEEKTAAKRAIALEKNKKEGDAFLAENAKKAGVMVTQSGLQYKVITEGKGPKPKEDDEVTVHYRGTFIDGTEFDSSYKNNEPTSFMARQVIVGWTEALLLMPEGSKWELYIPSELAYGEDGSGETIEPNAVLIFEVELIKVGLEQTGQ